MVIPTIEKKVNFIINLQNFTKIAKFFENKEGVK